MNNSHPLGIRPSIFAEQVLGYKAFKYQREFLDDPSKRIIVCSGRQSGKALALGTPIPTPEGWTTMEQLQTGDKVFDENGHICSVTFATEVMYDHDCYEVVFSDGSTIVADAEHLWLTKGQAYRKWEGRHNPDSKSPQPHFPKVLTTLEIKDTLKYRDYESEHAIDLAGPLDLPEADLPVAPYTFGVWLGDGTSADTGVTVATGEVEILQNIEADGYNVIFRPSSVSRSGYTPTYCIGKGQGLLAALKSLSVIKNKHIPAIYLRASYHQRLELLKGLMDTDGYCGKNGTCEFCTTSKQLADGILELCFTLGIKAKTHEGRATLYGKDCGPKYRVCFTCYFPVFKLTRKADRQHTGKIRIDQQKRRYIVAVNKVESVPVKCIQVDSESHLYLAGRSFIPTHNTSVAGVKAIYEACMNPGTNVLVLAPTMRQSSDTYDRIRLLLQASELLKPCILKNTKSEIQLSNGSTIRNLTVSYSGDHIRGMTSVSLAIVDEAAYLRCEDQQRFIHQIIEPMLWVSKGKLILLSSPWGKRGAFWEIWASSTGESANEEYRQYKAYRWRSFDNPLVREEILKELLTPGFRNSIAFRQERLAEFIDDVGLFWSKELVDRMLLTDPEQAGYCELWENIPPSVYLANHEDWYAGVDWAFSSSSDADRTVFAIVSRNPHTGLVRLRHIKIFDKGTPASTVEDYVRRANNRLSFIRVFSDTGIGKNSIDRLSEEGIPVYEFPFTQKSKMELFSLWLDLAERDLFKMPQCTELLHEMGTFELELKPDHKFSVHHSAGQHDDLTDASALAIFASDEGAVQIVSRILLGL